MKRPLILLASGLIALAASGAAMAHTDIGISIGVPLPVYVAPPPPVYYRPAPVYAPPPVVVTSGWYGGDRDWHDRDWHDRDWRDHDRWRHDRGWHGREHDRH